MELAIGTALLVGALCMLLLVIVDLTAVLNKRTTERATERFPMDRVGEDFLRSCKYSAAFDTSRYAGDAYTMEVQQVSEDVQRLLVYSAHEVAPALLWVEVQGRGEDAHVIRWSYRYGPNHSPQSIEESEETP